ncbi:DUF5677 domain-containing protein [Pseudomonas aeruginosa]|uniref:DUF5677 domain-containing protein n=1 Tax=Pseudomonas aeruginosa TaxID=287 RepID=UPI000FC4115A|nr:DUF5677 domain-containing protein [Pseudomonas aeruginosa]RUB26841.1 hypothetical protein IPC1432_25575 [Pseudomonas aeruginosa]UGW93190.1 DUF5677 domain-containing protein [Pseudomonas aeruginosa]
MKNTLELEMRKFGFLAPNFEKIEQFVKDLLGEQLVLLRDMNILALEMVESGAELSQGQTSMSPIVISTLAMLRSLENFQAGIILLERGMSVEPKILARCIYENAFCIGAAFKNPIEFSKILKDDNGAAKLAQAKLLMKQEHSMSQITSDKVRKFIDEAKPLQKQATINIAKIAESSGFGEFYLYYRVLSGEAMHLSADSLLRHIFTNEENSWSGFNSALINENELIDSAFYLSNSTMCAILAYNDFINKEPINEKISEIWARLVGLVFEKNTREN